MESIVAALLDMFPDTVTIQPGTVNGAGTFTAVGAPVSVAAQVSGKTQMVQDVNGRERVSRVQAILAATPDIRPDYEYTLPARFIPNKPRVIHIDVATDENGYHHATLFF